MNKIIILVIIGALSGIINGLTGLGHAGAILFGLSITNAINDYNTIIGTTLYTQLLPVVILGFWNTIEETKLTFTLEIYY